MGDAVFMELLTETATVLRPRVALDDDGAPKTPAYERTGDEVRLRVMPGRIASADGLLGRTEDATRVVYAEMADLRPADRLEARPVRTELADDADAGETTLPVESVAGLLDGQRVVVGDEEVTLVAVGVDEVTVTPGLAADHEAGEAVEVLVRYEVLTVEDEAGAGHHLRLRAIELI